MTIKDYDDTIHYHSTLSSFHQRWISNSYDKDSMLKEFNTIRNIYYLDDVVADMKAEGCWDVTMRGLLK